MRSLLFLLCLIALNSASNVQIKIAPTSVSFPEDVDDFELSAISTVNNNILGLSAEQSKQFVKVSGDLFSRPKALAIIQVSGVESLGGSGIANYQSTDNDLLNSATTESKIKSIAGSNEEYIELNTEISGSQIANEINAFSVSEDLVKTKIALLRKEFMNLQKIILYLKKSGAKLDQSSPALLNIYINGLNNAIGTPQEIQQAKEELNGLIDELTAVLKERYADQVVVEVITTTATEETVQNHFISKREAAAADASTIQTIRKNYNIYSFTQGDYPAIFAIFAGVSIILAIAILFIGVGMWTMDPGKDSIIYRMTTTKLKKD
uniref:DUF4349 domain-containing protein n=1 Tax=Parastrongyloides trichosuri TaxID=131310 RepID=A0A0N4Z639_PARTI